MALTLTAHGQNFKENYHNPQINFYEVVAQAEDYFKNNSGGEGSGQKGYQRWKYNNEYKYYPSGDRSQTDPYFTIKAFKAFKAQNPIKTKVATHAWQDLGPYTLGQIKGHYSPGLGRVESFYVNPQNTQEIYLGSRSGGFWYTTNEGATWAQSTTDFLPVSGVNTMAVNPQNADSILINLRSAENGTSHGIYRSNDGGQTWQISSFSPANLNWGGLGSNAQINVIAYHPRVPGLVFIGTNRGFYKSTDHLQTYTSLLRFSNVTQIAFHPTDDAVFYAYSKARNNNSILISKDTGTTYSTSPGVAFDGNEDLQIATSPQCADCVWTATNDGVEVSYDQGSSFTFLSNPNRTCDGFAVNDLDTSKMIYGMLDIYRSSDGGRTFPQATWWAINNTITVSGGQYVHADLRKARSLYGTFYVATDGYLAKSDDNGITWQILSDGTGIRENYNLAVSQSNIERTITGSQDNGTSVLREDGWLEYYGADGMEGLIHPLNDDFMLGSVQFGNRRVSFDGGLTQENGNPNNFTGYWVAPILNDPNNQMRIYNFGDSIYLSDDFTKTWRKYPQLFSGTINHAAIGQNSSVIAYTVGANIALSTDSGKTATSIRSNLPNAFITDVAFAPHNDSIMVVTYARYQNDNQKIFITLNQGQTWQNITANLGNMPLRTVVIDHSPQHNIYVGAEIGVYTKPLNGTTWSLYNTSLPNCTMNELEIMYGSNILRGVTWGRGMWQTHLVNRENYPQITNVEIKHAPSFSQPKADRSQPVRAKINYNGTLTKAWVEYGFSPNDFSQSLPMSSLAAGVYESDAPLPSGVAGTALYFRVKALGANGDTSVTHKFHFTLRPEGVCAAQGNSNQLYSNFITQVNLGNLSHSSANEGYGNFTNQIANLQHNNSYTISAQLQSFTGYDTLVGWIDYNDNSEFEANEEIRFSAISQSQALSTFTTPLLVGLDTVKMRLRLSSTQSGNPASTSPCGAAVGEVEDYQVVLNGGSFSVKEALLGRVAVFPNPAKEVLNVHFSENKTYTFWLYNAQGAKVSPTYQSLGGKTKINTAKLTQGTYWLHYEVAGQSASQKIIIK